MPQILNENKDPTKFNYTYFTHIPKMDKYELPKDFRPINLCNIDADLLVCNNVQKVCI